MARRRQLIAIVVSLVTASSSAVNADTIFFVDDESGWQAAVDSIEEFDTTSANLALSNELTSPPADNTALPATLTFAAANTGLSRGFDVHSLNTPLIYNQSGGASTYEDEALSFGFGFGPGNNDDDWEVNILSGPDLFGFGFYFHDNDFTNSEESFSVFGSGDVLLGTITESTVPSIPINPLLRTFIGVVSDTPIERVSFNATLDHNAISRFRFGSAAVVPEPSALSLFAIGALGLVGYGFQLNRKTPFARLPDSTVST